MEALLSTFYKKEKLPRKEALEAEAIPSNTQWCNDTHQPCTHCQQPLAADTEQYPMVYRLPPMFVTQWLSALPTALAVRPADMQKPRLKAAVFATRKEERKNEKDGR